MISATCILGQYPITPTFSNPECMASVTVQEHTYTFSAKQIKWGSCGGEPIPPDVAKLDPAQLIFFVFSPAKNTPPTHLCVFKSVSKAVDGQIALTQKTFYRAQLIQENDKAAVKYQKALKRGEVVNRLLAQDHAPLLQVKREYFLKQVALGRDLYLTDNQDKKAFDDIIKSTQYFVTVEMFNALLERIRSELNNPYMSSSIQLARATLHEVLSHSLLAAEAYIQLLDPYNINEKCVEKIQDLVNAEYKSKNPQFFDFLENLDRNLLVKLQVHGEFFQRLLLTKDASRMLFEACLAEIQRQSKRKKDTECFICFALESKVEDWLTSIFVPDLTKIGLKPVYGPFGLSHNMDLNSFQSKGRTTELALVVCTPRLHARCAEDVGSITGCAQEVRIIQERYNDPDKKGTLFTTLLHGKRRDCIPTPILEPIFAAKLEVLSDEREEDLYDYYSKGLRLMTSLAGLESRVADDLKRELYATLSDMIFGNTMDVQEIQVWRQERYPRKYNLLKR